MTQADLITSLFSDFGVLNFVRIMYLAVFFGIMMKKDVGLLNKISFSVIFH